MYTKITGTDTHSDTSPTHQILGLRTYWSEKKSKWDKTDKTFFEENWRAGSLSDLYCNLDSYLAKIPPDERWNLFYTVARCGIQKREFCELRNIAFDLDHIQITADEGARGGFKEFNKYVVVVCKTLNVDENNIGLIVSGHGIHFVIELAVVINDINYFQEAKRHYSAICRQIKAALDKVGLPGKMDEGVFDNARLMRLPGTINRKEGTHDTRCVLIQRNIVPIQFDLFERSKLPIIEAVHQVDSQTMKKFPRPDTQAVLEGCSFVKWCKENPDDVSESQWYAMLSIVPRLPPEGRRLAHEYSEGYSRYSFNETESKIDQALEASGPRTCDNINSIWSQCGRCPNQGKVKSPIMIQGAHYIQTRDSGFRKIKIVGDEVSYGKVAQEDLRRYFEEQHPYRLDDQTANCFVWDGTHYTIFNPARIRGFAQEYVKPPPEARERNEFLSLIQCTNLETTEWFQNSTVGYLNLKNGVLRVSDQTLLPHSPAMAFRSIINFPYDREAKCPSFDQFLADVTGEQKDLENIILEFFGYALSNEPCWFHKALFLEGIGRNGKSTLLKVLKNLAGRGNYEALTLKQLNNDFSVQKLDGKLFNLAEEVPAQHALDDDRFKAMVSGGELLVSEKLKTPYTMRNKAKFIFSANRLPVTSDTSDGYFERLIVVPFTQKFTFELGNVDLNLDEKLKSELPGILNRVLEGYLRMKTRGGIEISPTVRASVEEYRKQVDPLHAWVQESLEVLPLEGTAKADLPFISNDDLYTAYVCKLQKWGENPLAHQQFIIRLKQLLGDGKERESQHRPLPGKPPKRGLVGLKKHDDSPF